MTSEHLINKLEHGVKIINNIDLEIQEYLDRLEINHGFQLQTYQGSVDKIPLPIDHWFPVEQPIIKKIFTCEHQDHFSDAIEIFSVSDDIKNAFVVSEIANAVNKQEALNIAKRTPYQDALRLLIENVVKPRLLGTDVPEIEPIVFNDFGQQAVTRYHQIGDYSGLHYDDCDHHPRSRSSISRNRLCFNIGFQPRYFVFQNLFYEDATHVVNHMMRYSDCSSADGYPLLKLKINPFEGYIAPIERILHEGYTYSMSVPDMSVAVRSFIAITTLPITKNIKKWSNDINSV